jgi:hypothetical protein
MSKGRIRLGFGDVRGESLLSGSEDPKDERISIGEALSFRIGDLQVLTFAAQLESGPWAMAWAFGTALVLHHCH